MTLGADTLGERHELLNPDIAIITSKVSEVGQGSTIRQADVLENLGEPLAVRGKASMVFHDHVNPVALSEFREFPQPCGGICSFLLVGFPNPVGVDSDGVTSEELGCLDPLLVVIDHFLASRLFCFPQMTLSVNHDEKAAYSQIVTAGFQFGEILFISSLVLEELVHVFHGVNSKFFLRDPGKVEVGDFLTSESPVKRPLCKREIKERLGLLVVVGGCQLRKKECSAGESASFQKKASYAHEEKLVQQTLCVEAPSFFVVQSDKGCQGLLELGSAGNLGVIFSIGIKLRLRKQGKLGYGSSMSITTKRGDDGGTDLMFGKRTAKMGNRIEAIGSIDELNAALGLVRVEANASLEKSIDLLQGFLVGLMGELAVLTEDLEKYQSSGHPSITEDEVTLLENLAHELEESGIVFDGWARPGSKGSRTGAHLDLARTVCRRAERRVLALSEELSNTNILLFLNRLSDLLWLYARHCEAVDQIDP